MTNLDIGELAAFALVAHTRSFSAAARQLYLTQSAVSRRVAHLERSLGVLLLDRSSRRLELTPVGTDLLVVTEQLLTSHRKLLAMCATATRKGHAGLTRSAAGGKAAGSRPGQRIVVGPTEQTHALSFAGERPS